MLFVTRAMSQATRTSVRVNFPREANLKELASDLDSFFSRSTLTDIVLYAEGQPIHAHKAVLAARSPVFQKLFEKISSENRPSVILINDLSYEVVQELVSYAYSGKVNTVSLELLAAAERYGTKGLKKICANELTKRLSVPNAVDILISSTVNKCPELETAAIKYVSGHWKHIRRDKSCANLYSWPLILVRIIDCCAKV